MSRKETRYKKIDDGIQISNNYLTMEETLIQYLEKQEYFQGENKRFLEVSIGKLISENIFQEFIDNDDTEYKRLESSSENKSNSRDYRKFSRYYFDDKIIEINHLNKNKKTLISNLLISHQKVKSNNGEHDLLLETKEVVIDKSGIPSQEKFLNVEDFELEIFKPNPHLEIIFNRHKQTISFRLYYPANRKQVGILAKILSEFKAS